MFECESSAYTSCLLQPPSSSPPWFEVHERYAERRTSEGQHESRKVSVERGKLVQWRNDTNVPVRAYNHERTSSAADTISFMNPATTSASNIRVVEKNPNHIAKPRALTWDIQSQFSNDSLAPMRPQYRGHL